MTHNVIRLVHRGGFVFSMAYLCGQTWLVFAFGAFCGLGDDEPEHVGTTSSRCVVPKYSCSCLSVFALEHRSNQEEFRDEFPFQVFVFQPPPPKNAPLDAFCEWD